MLNVTIWGARGSIPVSGDRFARHGGATTCIEIEACEASGETPPRIIIDCGTGLAELGKRWNGRPSNLLMLQTHMHWDHIQGFPFFGPFYNPAGQFNFWSAPRDKLTLREVLSDQMRRPTFPVGLDIMPSNMNFKTLDTQGEAKLGALDLAWTEVFHPSGCSAFCISYGGTRMVFSGDVEVQQGSRDTLIEFAKGADLLIMDAQYLPDEYPSRKGFGHSTPVDAVDVARRAGVKHLVLTHHDPTHDDERLDQKLEIARTAAEDAQVRIDNAHDGMTLALRSGSSS